MIKACRRRSRQQPAERGEVGRRLERGADRHGEAGDDGRGKAAALEPPGRARIAAVPEEELFDGLRVGIHDLVFADPVRLVVAKLHPPVPQCRGVGEDFAG